MDQKMKRRVRALASAVACTVVGLAIGARTFAQVDAVDRLRTAVQLDALQLRAQLDQEESGQSWSALLAHKTTVDSALAPLHLIRDAMESLTAGSVGVDLLRSFRTEWRDEPMVAEWSHPDSTERVRRSLATWLPMPLSGHPSTSNTPANGDFISQQTLHIQVLTGSDAWVGSDAPPTIAWTMDALWGDSGPALHARSWWRIPIAEPMRLDFPISPDGLDLWLDSKGARLHDDRGNTHAETWLPAPLFNNPPDIYALFDGLRLICAKDAATVPRHGASNHGSHDESLAVLAPTPTDMKDRPDTAPRAILRIRTITRADGTPVRTERWTWSQDHLQSVVIDQSPVRLVHHSDRSVEIVTEVDGVESSRTPHRSQSEIVHFRHGARLAIAFRPADPTRDDVAVNDPNATVPDRMVLSVDGRSRAWAAFTSVRLSQTKEPDSWRTERDTQLQLTANVHAALTVQFHDAVAAQSVDDVQRALAAIDAQHASCDAPMIQRVAEWELAALRMLDGGMDAACSATLLARWLPQVSHADAMIAVHRWKSYGYGRFSNELARIAGITNDQLLSLDAEDPNHQTNWGDPEQLAADESSDPTNADASTCDPTSIQDGARLLHDAVHAVVAAKVRDHRMASIMMTELCSCCSQHSAELRTCDTGRADLIAIDAQAVLAAALPDMDSVGNPREYAREFAANSLNAALRTTLSADDIAAMRASWDICAQATIAALRKASRSDAGVTAITDTESKHQPIDRTLIAAVEEELRLNRALVGNSYCPALLTTRVALLPDPATARRTVEQMVEAAIGREKRRVEVTGTLLNQQLQTARAEASRRRIISASVKLTLGVFMQWCASGVPPAN